MKPLQMTRLERLITYAKQRHLLVDHRFFDGFVYLDLGDQRYLLDEAMSYRYLIGLLAGHARPIHLALSESA